MLWVLKDGKSGTTVSERYRKKEVIGTGNKRCLYLKTVIRILYKL